MNLPPGSTHLAPGGDVFAGRDDFRTAVLVGQDYHAVGRGVGGGQEHSLADLTAHRPRGEIGNDDDLLSGELFRLIMRAEAGAGAGCGGGCCDGARIAAICRTPSSLGARASSASTSAWK